MMLKTIIRKLADNIDIIIIWVALVLIVALATITIVLLAITAYELHPVFGIITSVIIGAVVSAITNHLLNQMKS